MGPSRPLKDIYLSIYRVICGCSGETIPIYSARWGPCSTNLNISHIFLENCEFILFWTKFPIFFILAIKLKRKHPKKFHPIFRSISVLNWNEIIYIILKTKYLFIFFTDIYICKYFIFPPTPLLPSQKKKPHSTTPKTQSPINPSSSWITHTPIWCWSNH